MNNIVLISCVSQKTTYKTQACKLYTSTLFKLNLKYAHKLQPDAIYILSAKYGLLGLDQEIEPYEVTLNNMKSREIKSWADRVIEQLRTVADLRQDHFTLLAGDKYRKYLLPYITSYEVPLQGLRIGEQLQRLKALTS